MTFTTIVMCYGNNLPPIIVIGVLRYISRYHTRIDVPPQAYP